MSEDVMGLDEWLGLINDGRIFTVEFIKRTNGEYRVMNCRRGVKKGIKGAFPPGHRAEEDKRKNLITVYDLQKVVPDQVPSKGAYRRIDLDAMRVLRMKGKVWEWDFHRLCWVLDDDATKSVLKNKTVRLETIKTLKGEVVKAEFVNNFEFPSPWTAAIVVRIGDREVICLKKGDNWEEWDPLF